MRTLALASFVLLASAFAAVPVASAEEETPFWWYCTFDAYAFRATYDCRVLGVGGDGALYWCPVDPGMCANVPLVTCYFDPWWQECW